MEFQHWLEKITMDVMVALTSESCFTELQMTFCWGFFPHWPHTPATKYIYELAIRSLKKLVPDRWSPLNEDISIQILVGLVEGTSLNSQLYQKSRNKYENAHDKI